MSNMFFLPFLNAVRRTKGATPILPSDWPSPRHNKCSSLRCYYPNQPQSVPGIFQCQGMPDGRPCVGTYYVDIKQAKQVMEEHKKWLAEDERRRQRQQSQNASSSSKSRSSKVKSLAPTLPEKDEKYRPSLRKVKARRNLADSTSKNMSGPGSSASQPAPPPPPKEKPTPFVHRRLRRQLRISPSDSTPSLLDNAHVRINASIVGTNTSSVSLVLGSCPQPPPVYTLHPLPHSDPKALRPLEVSKEQLRARQANRKRL